MTTGAGSGTPPGWYPDGPGWERYWDGAGWTAQRRPAAPPAPAPPPAPPAWATAPPPRGSSRTGVWVVLAVLAVVVVAVATTLLVVQPWSDDEPAAGKGGKGAKGGTTETSGPTSPPQPAGDLVRGDLDGDGRGDVVGRFYDESEARLTLTNGNGTFDVGREEVEEEEHLVVGQFDDDPEADVVSWGDDVGNLQLEIADSDVPAVDQEFDLWFQVQAIKATFGDFDGDGLADVAAYGQTHRGQVSIWVLHNNGGGFDPPAKWAALPNATYGSTELIPGDFNGDGRDDVLAVVPHEPLVKGDFDDYYWYGDYGVIPLLAELDGFGQRDISTVDAELYDQEYAVGDFDGDGKDTLVADDYLSDAFVLYEYDGSGLRPTGETVNYAIAGDGVMDAVAAVDLDGNRLDDLVFTSVDVDDYSFSGVWTVSATSGSGLGEPAKWADLPDCSGDFCEVDYFPTVGAASAG